MIHTHPRATDFSKTSVASCAASCVTLRNYMFGIVCVFAQPYVWRRVCLCSTICVALCASLRKRISGVVRVCATVCASLLNHMRGVVCVFMQPYVRRRACLCATVCAASYASWRNLCMASCVFAQQYVRRRACLCATICAALCVSLRNHMCGDKGLIDRKVFQNLSLLSR